MKGLLVLGSMLLAGTMAFGQQSVMTCSSDDGQTRTCQAGPNRGIQFLRQRSDAACVEGQSYGIQRDRVWVSGGCRADFQVYNNAYSDDGTYSRQGTYNDDDTYWQYPNNNNDNDADDQGRVRRHHRHHRDQNGNVYDDDDNYNNGQVNNDGRYNDPYSPQGTYGQYGNQDSTIGVYPGRDIDAQSGDMPRYYGRFSNGVSTCSSDQGSGQTYCQTGGAFTQVQMTRQNGRCAQGQTWGVSSYGLWVADGCVAEFTVQR